MYNTTQHNAQLHVSNMSRDENYFRMLTIYTLALPENNTPAMPGPQAVMSTHLPYDAHFHLHVLLSVSHGRTLAYLTSSLAIWAGV